MDHITVIICLLAVVMLVSLKRKSLKFPGTVLIMVFGILYLWNKFGLLTFYQPFTSKHIAYLFSCLFCFNIAALISYEFARKKRLSVNQISARNEYIENKVWLLNTIGIVGGIMMILDIRGSIGVSGIVPGNLNDIRGAFGDRTTGVMGQVGSLLFGTALPGLILGLRQWLRMDKHSVHINSLLLFLVIIIMFGVSISSGGRQAVLEIILTFFAVILYGGLKTFNRKRIKTFIIVSISVFVLGTTYMVTVASQRAEFGMAGEKFLLNIWNAQYSDWYEPVAAQMSPKVTLPLTAIHGYFPYNLTGLAVFFDAVDDHAWGGFQGEHILRQLRRIGLEWPYAVTFKREYNIDNINWPTIFGAMVLDFGVIGSILAIVILGWLVGRQFGRYIYYDSATAYLFTALTFIFIFHSTMYSPFQETLLLYGLIWSVILTAGSITFKKRIVLKLFRFKIII